jgi:hypothetical protein
LPGVNRISTDPLNSGFFTSFDPPFSPALTHPGNKYVTIAINLKRGAVYLMFRHYNVIVLMLQEVSL